MVPDQWIVIELRVAYAASYLMGSERVKLEVAVLLPGVIVMVAGCGFCFKQKTSYEI